MAGYYILAGSLVIIYLLIAWRAGKQYQAFIAYFDQKEFSLLFMAPISLYLLDNLRLIERFYGQVSIIQQKIVNLHGHKEALSYTKMFLAQLLSIFLLCILGSAVFAILGNGDLTLFFVGCTITFLIPFVLINQLSAKVKERREAILTELPEVVNKIILLVNAGETVQQALIRCVAFKKDSNNPLYKELRDSVNKMTNNEPFQLVMNDLSKRCGIQEVSIFTTTILLNYRKGGQDLVLSLRNLSQDLWNKRKSITRTKGEEASSKLVFPLVIIFVTVMIIVGWPAMQMM